MNVVNLYGRLTADPEIKYARGKKVDSSTTIATFTLAVKGFEEHTDFIRCKAFNKKAEVIEKFVRKGDRLVVEGEWHADSYEDKDGYTVYTNDCIVKNISLVETKEESNGRANSNSSNNSTRGRRSKSQ